MRNLYKRHTVGVVFGLVVQGYVINPIVEGPNPEDLAVRDFCLGCLRDGQGFVIGSGGVECIPLVPGRFIAPKLAFVEVCFELGCYDLGNHLRINYTAPRSGCPDFRKGYMEQFLTSTPRPSYKPKDCHSLYQGIYIDVHCY